jgi:hypothetical protein
MLLSPEEGFSGPARRIEMRKPYLFTALTLACLAVSLSAWAARELKDSATFTPPREAGTIFAVVNVDRGAPTTSLSVSWGNFRQTVGRGNPYGNCARSSNAGFIVAVRRPASDLRPFTLSTTGNIVRPPYQGLAPPEVSHPCYKQELIRAR